MGGGNGAGNGFIGWVQFEFQVGIQSAEVAKDIGHRNFGRGIRLRRERLPAFIPAFQNNGSSMTNM